MKIESLKVKGFRSLKDISWKPGDMNVIIGPSGSGKSNLLRILELISEAAKGSLSKYIQKLGGLEPLLWDGKATGIDFELKTSPVEPYGHPVKDCLTYKVAIERLGLTSAFKIDKELLQNCHTKKDCNEPLTLVERVGQTALALDEHNNVHKAKMERLSEEQTILSLYTGTFPIHRHIPLFKDQVSEIAVYHDFHTNQDSAIRQPAITRMDKRVEPDGQNLISVLHTLYTTNRHFKHEINGAMKAVFGDDFDELVFPPASDQRIQLRIRWKSLSREQSSADLSDGLLRFLFLLTIFASPSPAPVIAIDEPETGIHPGMLRILIDFAKKASKHSQIIFTTHSPLLLDAFKDATPIITVAKWEDGQTRLKVLNGDELNSWLSEYSIGRLFSEGKLDKM